MRKEPKLPTPAVAVAFLPTDAQFAITHAEIDRLLVLQATGARWEVRS